MDIKRLLKTLIVNLLLLTSLCGQSSDWVVHKKVNLNKAPTAYAGDYQGNFFVGFADGSLTKYNNKGELLENFAFPNTTSITLIDAQNNLKPFLFQFDNQRIIVLDRFSSVPKTYTITELGVSLAMTACPAPDGDFWLIENNPQRLKKVNPNRNTLILEIQMQVGDSIQKMLAYQNFVFIAHEKGLSTLDQYGGLLYQLEVENLIGMQLFNGVLHVFSKEFILEIDPAKGDILNKLSAPYTEPLGVIKLKDQLLILNQKRLTFLELESPD